MRAILVNTSDIQGGAARAAYRLHSGLRSIGVDSKMLVKDKASDDMSVLGPAKKITKGLNKVRPHLDQIPLKKYPRRQNTPWSVSWLPNNFDTMISPLNPDIIHLHWIGAGFIPLASLRKIDKPVIWTLHDMWAFTGGCHYCGQCEKYLESCGECPQLNSNNQLDLSRKIWKRKTKYWADLDLTIVTPSRWLSQCAQSSSLFENKKIKVIPNGIDLNRYKPMDRQVARQLLNLPLDKKFILFGAMNATGDPRKGFSYLQLALQQLAKEGWADQVELMVFGSSEPQDAPEFGLRANYLGRLSDDISLALLYSAADVFVAPSVQENLANTVVESLACGTPCVAFNIGGMPDMIEHLKNGYLAKPYESSDLAKGIAWIISDANRWNSLSQAARTKAEKNYELKSVARRYLNLYEEILLKRPE